MISFRRVQQHSRLFIAVQHLKLYSLLERVKLKKSFTEVYAATARFRAKIQVLLEKLRISNTALYPSEARFKQLALVGSTAWIRRQIDQSGFTNDSNYVLPLAKFNSSSEDVQRTFTQKVFSFSSNIKVGAFPHEIRYKSHEIASINLNDTFLKECYLYNKENYFDLDHWSSPVLESAYGFLNPTLSGYKNKNVVFGNFRIRNHIFIAGEFAYIFGRYINNYWHFLFEYLPKLLVLRRKEIVVIPGNLNARNEKFLLNYLDTLGLKYLKLDVGKTYMFEKLHVPSAPIIRLNDFEYSIDVNLLKRYKASIQSINELEVDFDLTRNKIVFLTRHSPRRVVLDAELQKVAIENEFVVLDPAALSIAQQASMFKNAKAIISYPGAVWGNLVFAPPTLRVFNIVSPILGRATLHQTIAFLQGSELVDIQIQNTVAGHSKFIDYTLMDKQGLIISRAEAATVLESIREFLQLY